MPKEHRARMLAHAGAFLAKIGFGSAKGFKLTLLVPRRTRIEICCNGLAVPSEVPCEQQRGRWLSPLEEQILEALSDGKWHPSPRIAQALELPENDRFKGVLTNLVDREILDSATGRGYRLAGGSVH